MSEELNIVEFEARCLNLLSKGMYINMGLPPEERVTGDGYFWCGKTQGSYGPDDELCDAEYCLSAVRSCYEKK